MLNTLKKDFDLNPLDVNFTLDVNMSRLATFGSLSGGEIENNVIKHNTVNYSGEFQTLLIPGPMKFSPIELERGYGNSKELYNWFVEANTGAISSARKNVTITLNVLNEEGFIPLVSWNLIKAWPSKIGGFNGSQNNAAGVAKFSITLVAESIERVDP